MSRETKFRVWLKDEKEYIPNFVEDNDAGDGNGPLEYDVYYIAPETGAVIKHHNHREFGDWMYTVEGTNANREVEIEQYTGLKDKNGKEIYEGDIVKTNSPDQPNFKVGVIEFVQQAFWISNVPSNRPDHTHSELLLQYWETEIEVVGNIHENPELLGGEE